MKKVETYTAKKNGQIMLNANELYQDVSESIKKEIMEKLMEVSFHRYPDETNQELIDAYSRIVKIPSENIMAGNGSDEMLGFMIAYFLGKGKKLFTLAPDFSMYDYYASMHETTVLKYPCEKDGYFNVDAFIEYGRRRKVDMILFSNPNNPTGHFLNNHELIKIIEAFPTIPVIIDEAYSEFAKESIISKVSLYPNLYVTRTLSKAFGLAGVRLGFLISNKYNMKKLRKSSVPYNISSIDQSIGTIVLQHASEYQIVVEDIIAQREILYEKVKDMKEVTFYPSQANYLFGRSSHKEELVNKFQAAGIIIRTYTNDSFRITIGSPKENQLVYEILMEFNKEVNE